MFGIYYRKTFSNNHSAREYQSYGARTQHCAAVALRTQRTRNVLATWREQGMNSRALVARQSTARCGRVRVDGPLKLPKRCSCAAYNLFTLINASSLPSSDAAKTKIHARWETQCTNCSMTFPKWLDRVMNLNSLFAAPERRLWTPGQGAKTVETSL